MPKLFRKVIRIRAEDSPNVRMGLAQVRAGLAPTDEELLPGVLTYFEYLNRRATWDAIRQCVGLDGMFYEGAEILLCPPAWLARAKLIADVHYANRTRRALGIGIDPGEGVANTSMAAVDEDGLIELVSRHTPNTADVPREALAFARSHGVTQDDAHRICFDAGGGGRQAADTLREQGWEVSTVAFGETLLMPLHRGMTLFQEKTENREDRSVFFNRRSEMYYSARLLIDPTVSPRGWGIPGERYGEQYKRLHFQLSKIPLTYDAEGRIKLLPKNRPPGETVSSSKKKYLIDLIGYSPDEADSMVVAIHAMQRKTRRIVAGVG
jgi:hypothetical protein